MDDATRKKLNELTNSINKVTKSEPSIGAKFAEGIVALIIAIGLMIPVYMLCATVGCDLWAWFITPIFGIILGKAQVLGILLVVNFMCNLGNIRPNNKALDDLGQIGKAFALNIAMCINALVIWAIGAVLVTYVM
ncbi:MAG: hypothetical protein HOG49_30565 [Candidatus Scalindua sp.]|jgi:hypothetical protein|nr:hypothetical protein [Candidatus Scalindua sp.]